MTDDEPVEIRELAYPDHDAVRRLHARCFPEAFALDDLVLDGLFGHAHAINFVAEVDDTIVGYAGAIHGARPKARLLTIHTDPEHRQSGIASALMDALEERLAARKARTLELEVHVDNEAAQQLYRERGFEVVREDPAAYPSLEEPRGYVMAKPLDADGD